MKTIKDLAKALCQAEGLKKQVNIAQMSEILGVLSDILFADFNNNPHPVYPPAYIAILSNGFKRAKKRKAKRGKK